ncbi:hypothetical protein C1H46_039956 [Malus baccata]|uniref:Uncharacterized protein n=1 Tax=Malus baccata TaxID=106549 RepID=A0A540KJV9_MALBA|nr:hypothetical protein C1H46_039956 [Malus baccata]
MPLGPTVSMVAVSSTSLVTHPVLSAQRTHRRPWTSKEAQPSGDASSVHGEASQTGALADYKKLLKPLAPRPKRSPLRGILNIMRLQQRSSTMRWPPTWLRYQEPLPPKHHYKLSNLDSNQMEYINDLCSSRFTQWKSDLHKHYELYDGSEVALKVGCPMELLDRRDEWEKKVKANSINRSKKKLFHQSGSRRCSYRLEERRKGGSKFPKIDMFKQVYIRPEDELTEQLHGQTHVIVAQEFRGRIPVSSLSMRSDHDFCHVICISRDDGISSIAQCLAPQALRDRVFATQCFRQQFPLHRPRCYS